jgi:hypothetical protein
VKIDAFQHFRPYSFGTLWIFIDTVIIRKPDNKIPVLEWSILGKTSHPNIVPFEKLNHFI